MEGEGEGGASNSRMGEQYKWEPNPYLAAMVSITRITRITRFHNPADLVDDDNLGWHEQDN